MSEELSDMDEDELQGLVDEGMADATQEGAEGSSVGSSMNAALPARRKSGAKRRKWRGFR
jgi:Xaa-Pro aminopeptidase